MEEEHGGEEGVRGRVRRDEWHERHERGTGIMGADRIGRQIHTPREVHSMATAHTVLDPVCGMLRTDAPWFHSPRRNMTRGLSRAGRVQRESSR